MGLFGRKSVERLSAKGDVAGLVDVLAEAASKEDLEAHKAAAALLELGRPGIDALVGALRDPSACAVAAVSLGAATDPAVVGPLVEALGDPDSGVRGWAARALAKRDEPEAVEALAGALDDTSEGVREIAARGLGKRGDARALDVLIDQILRDPFMEAYEVAPMLGAIGDSRAVPALKKVLRARITPVGRQHALDALKAIGGSDTEAVLAKEEPLSELDAIKEALQQLPVVYATRATVLGPGAGQAAEQIPIICRNIDDAIAALRTGKDPGGEPIEARQVGLGLQNLVDDVSGPAFSGWMLTALDPEGVRVLEYQIGRLAAVAAGLRRA